MDKIDLDVLLTGIEKPGRYTGGEIHSRKKDFSSADFRIALAFPDVYEVGFSHWGLRLLYHLLNDMPGVMADRVYAPWPDFEERLRTTKTPLYGLESRKPLSHFHMVGFSLQYELSYTNIFTILELSGIPFRCKDRSPEDPFIIAGGPCAFNPEPLADFLDLVVLGEAEEVLPELIALHRHWQKTRSSRRDFLEAVRKVPGVYIPAFFQPVYDRTGDQVALEPVFSDYVQVKKRVVSDLDRSSPLPTHPLVPLLDTVHNRLGLEVARGCTRGCRFCQAGYIYRPVRERNPRSVYDLGLRALKSSGFEEISLLSLSTGDYCQVVPLLEAFMQAVSPHRVAVSLPSMRVGTLTQRMMELVKTVRKTGFTVAPEAGSERLRRIINKNVTEEELLDTADNAYGLGWKLIKLYFMIGLPTETEEDLEALVDLSRKVWKIGRSRKGRVNVSVSTFVPKPMTPFQWLGQIPEGTIGRRLEWLKKKLNHRGIRLKWNDPYQSFLEAVFARGGRRLGNVLERAWRLGCRFDGWGEHLRREKWEKAFALEGIDPAQVAGRTWEKEDFLPWDHLNAGVEKRFLWAEYEKALKGGYTGDCRWEKCTLCGVCDHKTVTPRLFRQIGIDLCAPPGPSETVRPEGSGASYWFRYQKKGWIRFFGQLEIGRIFERAFRRADLPIAFTQGFHPHPKLSFGEALPLGTESEVEEGIFQLTRSLDPEQLKNRLNAELPEGLRISEIRHADPRRSFPRERIVTYRVSGLTASEVDAIVLIWSSHAELEIRKKTKRGEIKARLRDVVLETRRMDDTTVVMQIMEQPSRLFRPQSIIAQIIPESPEMPDRCRVCKVSVVPLES